MPGAATTTTISPEGFLLLDHSMCPIFINPAATAILVYPGPCSLTNLNRYLADKIRSTLVLATTSKESGFVSRFKSGRREYLCRSYQLNGMMAKTCQSYYAVILERASRRTPFLSLQLQERFRLTTREQEVAQLLFEGLTSKEIGMRMQISPNTVKSFLRLIMVKMGVSTRSGVVGKALTTESS